MEVFNARDTTNHYFRNPPFYISGFVTEQSQNISLMVINC